MEISRLCVSYIFFLFLCLLNGCRSLGSDGTARFGESLGSFKFPLPHSVRKKDGLNASPEESMAYCRDNVNDNSYVAITADSIYCYQGENPWKVDTSKLGDLWQSDKHLQAMVPVFLGRNGFSRSFV